MRRYIVTHEGVPMRETRAPNGRRMHPVFGRYPLRRGGRSPAATMYKDMAAARRAIAAIVRQGGGFLDAYRIVPVEVKP